MAIPMIAGVELRPAVEPPVLRFSVHGKPIPKARPRVTRRRGKSVTYTPTSTLRWEAEVRTQAASAASWHRWAPLAGRVAVSVQFDGAHASADVDNLLKAILDACNGVLWKDDRQVRDARIFEVPMGGAGILVEVRDLGQAPKKARKRKVKL